MKTKMKNGDRKIQREKQLPRESGCRTGMELVNAYGDAARASSYAGLGFPGTYYLAFRDIPELVRRHVSGKNAIDFGCGAGRSTRFIKSLGFEAVGLDISAEMVCLAREADPKGTYLEIENGVLNGLPDSAFDLVFSAFTFDNISTIARKSGLFREFRRVLRKGGTVINLVSSPEMYTHDWISIKTTCFQENFSAGSGDRVFTVISDTGDLRPVEDELCTDEDYRRIYAATRFSLTDTLRPLGRPDEPFEWVNEHRVAPWTVYVLHA